MAPGTDRWCRAGAGCHQPATDARHRRLGQLRRTPSGSCWSDRRGTVRAPGCGAPFSDSGRVLVGADDGGVDRHQPLNVSRGIRPRLRGPEHPVKKPRPLPTCGNGYGGWPTARIAQPVPPRHPGPELPHDPVEDCPVVQPWSPRRRPGQQRLHEFPLSVGRFMAAYHHSMITLTTEPSSGPGAVRCGRGPGPPPRGAPCPAPPGTSAGAGRAPSGPGRRTRVR